MKEWSRHLRSREFRFLALVFANLICVAIFLGTGLQVPTRETGGWRRIDTEAVRARIEAGDLMSREASWYHPAEPGRQAK